MEQAAKKIFVVSLMVYFCVYAASPLCYTEATGNRSAFSADTPEYQKTKRVYLLEVFLAHVYGAVSGVETPLSVDVFAGKKKAVISAHSLVTIAPPKQAALFVFLTPEHYQPAEPTASYDQPVHPLTGFHLLVSGLSPPV